MKILKFEDLKVWQEARKLVKKIYLLTNKNEINKEYSLKDQIQRCAVSIMNNIAEGHARTTNKDFLKFLVISRSSAAELKSMCYLLFDLNFISENHMTYLLDDITSISKMINAFITHLKKPPTHLTTQLTNEPMNQ